MKVCTFESERPRHPSSGRSGDLNVKESNIQMQPAEEKTIPELTEKSTAQTPECSMSAKPQQEHEWLHKLVGEWTCEGDAAMGPEQSQTQWKATEVVRSLGGLWVVAEGTSDMPGGGAAISMMTLGYDPLKKRYLGTFVASMMTHLWVYDGAVDAGGTVLTLDTEGPAMSGDGRTAKYQDVIEMKSDDERTLTSLMLGEDGKWQQVMAARYRRTK
jgi:hypothetical protein